MTFRRTVFGLGSFLDFFGVTAMDTTQLPFFSPFTMFARESEHIFLDLAEIVVTTFAPFGMEREAVFAIDVAVIVLPFFTLGFTLGVATMTGAATIAGGVTISGVVTTVFV